VFGSTILCLESVSMDMYAWQQLPGATRTKNNSVWSKGHSKSFTGTFATLLMNFLRQGL